jgi:xanthine/CO dehydrogenase XdhC/CoxF family maturation factor/CTP:molybdopterin cytidylyltransferase MocA
MKEVKQIIQAYRLAREQQKRAVLATVVHIEGSAYRAPGARMLITEDGLLTGAVSGGCLEGDVLRKAMLVMMEERPMLVTYDTSDEEGDVIGVSLGCNGVIRILLEPISSGMRSNPIRLLEITTETREPSVVVTFFNTANRKHLQQGTTLIFSGDGYIAAETDLPLDQREVTADLLQTLFRKASAFVEYPACKNGEVFTAFIEYIAPTPALVIAGAGNDIQPLVQMAGVLGWDITLIDGRPAYANEARFPGCQVMISQPEEALKKISVDEQTAVVLMSHNYHYDKAVLIEAIKTTSPYIGILGPKKKTERLLQELKEEGTELSALQLARVFGPVGFDIGAETSEEIALSVLAEIKSVFDKRPGASLRNQNGKIHRRKTEIIPSMQTYGVLLLAAGSSKRLGTPKQSLVYKGKTLLQRAVDTALELHGGATIVVVNNGSGETVNQPGQMPVDVIVNENAKDGMAGSIRKGMEHIADAYPYLTHVLIMLCDQPFVNTMHLRSLIDKQQSAGTLAVASYYDGRKGVPALFHRSLFPELQNLEGDSGAKHLIERLGDTVVAVDFPEGAIDVDTKEMFQQITELTPATDTK